MIFIYNNELDLQSRNIYLIEIFFNKVKYEKVVTTELLKDSVEKLAIKVLKKSSEKFKVFIDLKIKSQHGKSFV